MAGSDVIFRSKKKWTASFASDTRSARWEIAQNYAMKFCSALTTPILFVQGTRDSLCPLDLLERVRTEMKAPNFLHVVEGGDHSLRVPKRQLQATSKTQEDIDRQIFKAIAGFVDQLPADRRLMRMRRKTKTKRKRKPTPVSIRSGQVEFVKVNTDAWRWRDVYRWLLGLRWPQFAAFVASLYVGLNLLFAALYSFQQDSIAGSTGGHWFFDCFFFSVQTLATVGYGHMYPQTLYGHIVSTIEIMTGIFLLAAMTGLDFRALFAPDRARCVQQFHGHCAVEWEADADGANRQRKSAQHGRGRVPDHVLAR